ncbi:MAG: tRNA pseudouridine(38-40) synthase TruA [Lachnospiraceae bacterium]
MTKSQKEQVYKCIVQYEGTRYQGWQKQTSIDNTIQGKLESLLSKMCDTKIEVHGSGRTDSGVHALGQVISFSCDTKKEPEEILEYMNLYLPEDIAIISVEKMPSRFHARLHAKSKTYRYRVLNSKIPHIFDRRYTYQVPEYLKVEKMQEATTYLIGTHDFKSFTSNKRGKKSTVRTISSIDIKKEGQEIIFTFKGDGFLYHMIRILVGTLLEVGTGKRSPESMKDIIAKKNREASGALVPGKGLTLMEVRY